MVSASDVGSKASPLSPLLSLREGDVLASRYRIESIVKVRGAAVHFAATDLTSGTRVSAHVLAAPEPADSGAALPGDEAEDSARVAFLAGARRAMALTSPHLARVLDAGVTAEGHPWIVREHLGSDTLASHLRDHGALATREAVDVALAVCDGIAEAHAHGILHLSLGPHAVHVAWSASGLVDIKMTGVGTAAAESALALGSSGDVESILRAPEQLRHGSIVDGRADVWAIAVLLHTMLAGASPFSADTPSGASLSVIVDDPPSLAGVPDELAEIVERALAKDPGHRPSTVLDLAEALVDFSSRPEIERDRIAKRRGPLELVMPGESAPTLVIDKRAYEALAQEQRAAKSRPPPPPSSTDVLVDVTPSVRELPEELPQELLEEVPEEPAVPTLAPVVQAMPERDIPTRITHRPNRSFTRRKAFKILGLTTAAACVALLVLVGTEGPRLSRNAAPTPPTRETAPVVAALVTARTAPAAVAPLVAPTDLPAAPAETATASSPTSLPEAPREAIAPKRVARPSAVVSPPAPSAPSAPTSSPSITTPPSKPSPSGSADDLRRFLDDRR